MPGMPAPAAIVLAAGRGQRMRPLTDTCPKPLLPARGQPLMQWHLHALAAAGTRRIVINTGWLGGQISAWARSGQPWQELPGTPPELLLSEEERDFGHTLETAGGIARALPLLTRDANDIFWAVAGDIHAPRFAFSPQDAARFAASGLLAHLWLVPNPPHHPAGDFILTPGGLLQNRGDSENGHESHTFGAIALYRRALFAAPWCDIPPGNPQGQSAPLAPLLRRAIAAGQVSGQLYTDFWADVGTPQRLDELNSAFKGRFQLLI